MSDARIVVRDARPGERDAVRDLTMRAYGEYSGIMTPGAWSLLEGALREALASGAASHRIVAERGGALVGSVMLFPPDAAAYGELTGAAKVPELRLLAVAPEARGAGVGALLVHECVRRVRADGAAAIGLHTADSMRGAMRLYERIGFVRAPETDFHPEGGELVKGFRLEV